MMKLDTPSVKRIWGANEISSGIKRRRIRRMRRIDRSQINLLGDSGWKRGILAKVS